MGTKLNDAFGGKGYAFYGPNTVKKGTFTHLPKGRLKPVKKPVAGAVAEYESGTDAGERTTLTRVAAGAIIAGPVGAIVGGMFKKDRTKGYVTVTFSDGEVIVIDGPLKDESKMREFTQKVNDMAAVESGEPTD